MAVNWDDFTPAGEGKPAPVDWSQFKPADGTKPAEGAKPTDWSQFTPAPEPKRGPIGEIAAAGQRGLYAGVRGAGAVLQAPAEMAHEEPGIISRFGQKLESYGKEGESRPDLAPEEGHNGVTNFLAKAAEAPGAALPLLASTIPAASAGAAIGSAVAPGAGTLAGGIGGALASGIAGGSTVALQTYHEKYHEGLDKGLSDEAARDYAAKSAALQGGAMGAVSAVPFAGPVAKTVLGVPAKGATEAMADVAGRRFLPELGKSAAELTAVNTGLGVAGAAGQAAIDADTGLPTPTPGEAAVNAIIPSLAGAFGFLPLGVHAALGTARQSKAVRSALENPDANTAARKMAALQVHEALNRADPDAARMWDLNAADAINAGKPIDLDASFVTQRKTYGPQPEGEAKANEGPAPGEYVPSATEEEEPPQSVVDPSRGPISAAAAISEQVTRAGFPFASEEAAHRAIATSGIGADVPEGHELVVQQHPSTTNRWAVTTRPIEGGQKSPEEQQDQADAARRDDLGRANKLMAEAVRLEKGAEREGLSDDAVATLTSQAKALRARGEALIQSYSEGGENARAVESGAGSADRAAGEKAPAVQDEGVPATEVPGAGGEAGGVEAAEPHLDALAHEAATSPLNDRSEPTPAQIDANNYKLGHVKAQGLNLSIENPAGSIRRGTEGENPWEAVMPEHYGYVKGSVAADGDHVDAFVGPKAHDAKIVYVIDQIDPKTKAYDEPKAMIGFDSQKAAHEAYTSAFSDGSGDSRIGAVTPMFIGKFKEWVKDKEQTTKPVAYKEPEGVAHAAEKGKQPVNDLGEHLGAREGVSGAGEDRQQPADKQESGGEAGDRHSPEHREALEQIAQAADTIRAGDPKGATEALPLLDAATAKAKKLGIDQHDIMRAIKGEHPKRIASEIVEREGEAAKPAEVPEEAAPEAAHEDFETRRGEVKAFKSAKVAKAYRDQPTNRVPKNFEPRQTEDGWVLSRAKMERSEAQKANDQRLAKARSTFDSERDSLGAFMGKMGGLKADELLRDGVDSASLKDLRSGVVGKPAYRTKGGLSMDGMAELAAQHGFPVLDEDGRPDATKMRELVQHEIEGNRVYTPEGYERLASLEAERRAEEARALAENDFPEEDLRQAGYDDLSDGGKDAAAELVESDLDKQIDDAWNGTGKVLTDEEADRVFGYSPEPSGEKAEGAPAGRAGEGAQRGEEASRDQEEPQSRVVPSREVAIPQRLAVEYEGKRYPVASMEEAAQKWDQFRQEATRQGAGASDIAPAFVVNARGERVGRVAYNGRIFDPKSGEPVFDPYAKGELSHPGNEFERPQSPVNESLRDIAERQTAGLLRDAKGKLLAFADAEEARDFAITRNLPKKFEPEEVRGEWHLGVAEKTALELKGETESEIRTREALQAKSAEAAKTRENAPSEKGFTLTGSDRNADVAEAHGQKPMFSRNSGRIADEKNLIVQHNITAANILHVDKMGGMAVPSLAITKVDQPLHHFGEVTLIGPPEMADPKGYAKTKVFGADVYSPRYPNVSYKLGAPELKKLNAILAPFRQEGEREAYGSEVSNVRDLENIRAFVRYAESGKFPGTYGRPDFKAAGESIMREIGAPERIFAGFDYNGNRRYFAHTLERVVKMLKKELRGGESAGNIYGIGQLRTKFAPQFRSLNAIRAAKDKIISKDQFEEVKKEVEGEFFALSEALQPYYRHFDPKNFQYSDTVMALIEDSAKQGFDRTAKEYGFDDVPQEVRRQLWEFTTRLRNMPTEYFEGKILRDVDLHEFKAAVVPDSLPAEARAVLEKRHLSIYEYPHGDEAGRAAAIKRAAQERNVLFKRGSSEGEGSADVASVTKRLGIDAKIAKTEEDLPEHLRDQIAKEKAEGDVRGVFDPKTGDVWLVGSNIKSEGEAVFVALHESAHRGLAKLFGDDLHPVLDRIYDTNENVQSAASAIMKQHGYDQRRATEEALADMALRGQAKSLKGWQGFVRFIRDWLAKRGFPLKVTDEMAEHIAGAAAEAGKRMPVEAEAEAKFSRAPVVFDAGRMEQLRRDILDGQDAVGRMTKDLNEMRRLARRNPSADKLARMKEQEESIADQEKAVTRLQREFAAQERAGQEIAPINDERRQMPLFSRASPAPASLLGVASKLREGLSTELQQREVARGGFRSALATLQRNMGVTDVALEKARKAVDAIPIKDRWDAMHQYQTGGANAVTDAKLKPIFEGWKANVDERANKIQGWDEGYLKEVLPHYFSQMWKDPAKALEFYQRMMSKGPLEGGKSFLKKRAYASYKEGMSWKVYSDQGGVRYFDSEKDARAVAGPNDAVKAPLEPISQNFIDIAQASLQQMDKFIAMHEYRQWLKEEKGWVKRVRRGEDAPLGYARVDDPAFRTQAVFPIIDKETGKPAAAAITYDYMVPAMVAKDLNNYLSNGLYQFGLWRNFRYAQNLLLSARLGFSAFHAGFTTMDTLVSHTDVGARYLLQGDVPRALATWGKALTSPISAPLEGRKLLKQFYGEAAADANTAAVLRFLTEGGARGRMHATDFNNSWAALKRAWSDGDLKGTALQALPAVMEGVMRPIMHYLVPWQKMTARVLLAKFEMDRVAAKLGAKPGEYAKIADAMGEDAMRQIAYKVVQQVDDRLGQVAYENLFWNKFAKDIAQASIQSVGWNVGTANVILGGIKDVGRLVKPEALLGPLDKAGRVKGDLGRISGRLSYLISLNLTVGMMGAALQYAMTGEQAKDLRDYFFPRTGRKNPDGSDERISMPSYIKDEYALSQHPVTTVQHKLHPTFSMVAELLKNEDFYGNQIVNPDDPWAKMAKQAVGYLGKSVEPYAVQNLQQNISKGQSPGMAAAPFIGITPAPASVSRTPFEAYVAERYAQSFHSTQTPEGAEKAQARREAITAIKAGQQPNLSVFSPAERMSIFTAARTPIQQQRFNRLSLPAKISAWERATPEERAQFRLKAAIIRDFSMHQMGLEPEVRTKVMEIIRAG